MARFLGQSKSIHEQKAKTGILLVNLGTPDAPDTKSLRKYLRVFLSDPRVVEIPRLIWMIILHGIILRVRPAKSAALYKQIWTEQGSPLKVITEAQQAKLAQVLDAENNDNLIVDYAMRYGEPSIASRLKAFQKQRVENIIVLPLYPQYAGATTGSVFDEVAKEMMSWRWIPQLTFISGYHDHDLYIKALAKTVSDDFEQHGKPKKLVMSYHGMPKQFLESGDPYYCFCMKTSRLLAAELGLAEEDFMVTFQSRFGKAEWLKPYTDESLESLAEQGIDDVAIISPAFSADCLETLEELEHENREIFEQAGGKKYRYIKALNDNEEHIELIKSLVTPYMK